MKNSLYNAIVFNLAWLACVLGGSKVALPVALVVIAIHLYFFATDKTEIALIAVVLLLGVVVDSVLIRSGLLVPPDGSLWPPLWLICLWGLFATTLNHSMKWFQSHTLFAMVVGGIAGALTYLAGTRLTDFALKGPQSLTLAIMFVLWGAVFPFCLLLARNLPARNLRAGEVHLPTGESNQSADTKK